ncbi:suppressor of fused domain protein [uncultured Pseudoteredinibacter sp.]|uniref:suppressor of fused domain protein n=1 Tax=uncultured Pseudoteredinibacter sp. TaxID=1641701 RepID=UPI0026218A06|nr:suppressor of fused domain protein [uncultured Pseudoteredinibacter sp.]
MDRNPASIPSERMKALYQHFSNKWGEPEHLIWFDPALADSGAALEKIHIGVWPADDECDVNTFITFGMSEKEMSSGERTEVQFAVRGHLTDKEIHQGAKFLANISEYPFSNNLSLDWWHRLKDAGRVPFFNGCTKILFRPPFSESQCKDAEWKGDIIKFLFLVPLTETENEALSNGGPDSYHDYMHENDFDLLGHK